jgi:hypothetical protein
MHFIHLPLLVAIALAYLLAAYLILPFFVHMGLLILRRGRIPSYTREADGLPADPVNIVLLGSEDTLLNAFAKAGWIESDDLTLRTGWKMCVAFVLNRAYPAAPFRPLYLFGRSQDHGFQIPIGKSPRKRHHIRFWAATLEPEDNLNEFAFWNQEQVLDPTKPLLWIGAATEDLGIGFTNLTYQIRHRIDRHVDEERENVLETLRNAGVITDEQYVESNRVVVGKYISDGEIIIATLKELNGQEK